jgi:type I restriction enzyme S subunit
MGEKNNIPQIRFKGFAENWKITKLNNISDIIGGGTPSTNVPEYWDGDIDWYSPTEIGDKVFATGSVKKITSLGLEKSSAKILPKRKTVLFTSRAGIGDMAILNKDGATNQGFQSLVLKNGIEPYFIYTAGHLIKKYALKHASGSTFLEVSGKQLGEMNLLIPTECEQYHIGSYFQNLDKLITLQQQKHDKLVTLKKAMLDKMFPKEGADVPEIRFKGFAGVWEERKLGEISESYSGGTPSVGISEFYNGNIPFIRSAEINCNSTELYITELGLRNSSAKLVNGGCILYALYGATSGEVGRSKLEGAINQAILAIKPSTGIDAEFITQWLRKKKKVIISTYLQGGQGNLSGSIVKNLNINLPCFEEQSQIGSYFQNLDKLISLHQQEIQKLKNIKKACLEKMFV